MNLFKTLLVFSLSLFLTFSLEAQTANSSVKKSCSQTCKAMKQKTSGSSSQAVLLEKTSSNVKQVKATEVVKKVSVSTKAADRSSAVSAKDCDPAQCDPANCDPTKCEPTKCEPAEKCDKTKCLPASCKKKGE